MKSWSGDSSARFVSLCPVLFLSYPFFQCLHHVAVIYTFSHFTVSYKFSHVSQMVRLTHLFLYEKTWTVLFIIYFQLYSLVVTDISKTCQWYQNAFYSIYKKKKKNNNEKERVVGVRGRGKKGSVSLNSRKERLIPKSGMAKSWRYPCFRWYQETDSYVTITHIGFKCWLLIVCWCEWCRANLISAAVTRQRTEHTGKHSNRLICNHVLLSVMIRFQLNA